MEIGLVNAVFPDDRFEEEVLAIARRLSEGPTEALAVAKSLVHQAAGVDRLDWHLDREIDRQLHTARWAPRVNISAATGRHIDRLVPALELALAGWETRVPTGRLNAWVSDLVAATPPPARGGRVPKVLFATQAGIRPPHFVLFTTGFLEAGYRRFVERRLREEFGFQGSPVHLSVRLRERRPGRAGRARARR